MVKEVWSEWGVINTLCSSWCHVLLCCDYSFSFILLALYVKLTVFALHLRDRYFYVKHSRLALDSRLGVQFFPKIFTLALGSKAHKILAFFPVKVDVRIWIGSDSIRVLTAAMCTHAVLLCGCFVKGVTRILSRVPVATSKTISSGMQVCCVHGMCASKGLSNMEANAIAQLMFHLFHHAKCVLR